MKRTLQVLNELEKEGVFARYAIGGAMGATFYTEPFLTFDLDVFVVLPRTPGGSLTLTPIYEALRARGYREENECVLIEGVPVQFLPAYNLLIEEAFAQACDLARLPFPEKVSAVIELELQKMAAIILRARGKIVKPWSASCAAA